MKLISQLVFIALVAATLVFSYAAGRLEADDTKAPPTETPPPVRIGNVDSDCLGGVAFIRGDAAGVVLDLGADATGKPGYSAPDWSINQNVYSIGGVNVQVLWGRIGNGIAARITSDRAVTVPIKIQQKIWPLFQTISSRVPGGIDSTCITGDGQFIPWSVRTDPPDKSSNNPGLRPEAYSLNVDVVPGKPSYVAAGFGPLTPFDQIDPILDHAASKYQTMRASAGGDWGDFVSAIADNLNNNRVYSTYDKRIAYTVQRNFGQCPPDFQAYFGWDSCFNGLLGSLEDPATARDTIRAVLSYQTPEGLVANAAHWSVIIRTGAITIDRSQPPVGSMCVWKMHQRWPDVPFLMEVYPKLVKWHDWWPKYSDGNHDGLFEWGSATGIFQEARYGTGWDDTPAYNPADGIVMIGTQMNADAIDLNCLWSMDADYLAKIATVLGKTDDAARFTKEHKDMNDRINKMLWNDQLGMYCSRLWDVSGQPGAFLTRITPMNFYPLICGAADDAKAKTLVAVMTDPKKFWGDWLLPTLPYDDPDWKVQQYWKGKVWGPVNYLLWEGVHTYCTPAQQADYVHKSVNLFMRNWTSRGVCGENYLSTDGTQSSTPHYTWGALLCEVGIDSLYDIDAAGNPVAQAIDFKDNVDLHNMPAGGKLYHVVAANGQVTITPESH